ncbi:zinc dependent phospholipase C family protein [Desulfofalx alkaliphila]|uniref:zinc dependent phospholipase C family protein n=1 Tax=Desulfofalx alkaliphila TaxID=105483 RepID=UPI0004E27A42|nr:zinc dependent phospholipase C family protein [Desulfofalx alkaliphila]
MPDLWTHIITGEEIVADLPDNQCRLLIRRHLNLFRFGCQGPDFFLYYNFWPWLRDKRGTYFGEIIHLEQCGNFFQEIAAYINAITDTKLRNRLTVYLMGLICHWTVDRWAHPYIHYISGIKHPAGNHKRIEAAIDSILAHSRWKIDTSKTPVKPYIQLGSHLPQDINHLYMQVLNKLYLDKAPVKPTAELIDRCYRHMMQALDFFYDPWGIKRRLLTGFDFITGSKINARYYIYRPVDCLKDDYLNEGRQGWCHPCDKNECYDYSLHQLLATARREAVTIINGTWQLLNSKQVNIKNTEQLTALFPNISFNTGKDTADKRPLLYTNPLLP